MQDDISDDITLSIMPIYHIALSCPLQYAWKIVTGDEKECWRFTLLKYSRYRSIRSWKWTPIISRAKTTTRHIVSVALWNFLHYFFVLGDWHEGKAYLVVAGSRCILHKRHESYFYDYSESGRPWGPLDLLSRETERARLSLLWRIAFSKYLNDDFSAKLLAPSSSSTDPFRLF